MHWASQVLDVVGSIGHVDWRHCAQKTGDVCGHITVRNGACYKCLNCGNSLGCS